MKRCIVCGNIGDDDSVVCNVCGNPFIDMESESDDGSDSLEPDERIEEQLKEVLTWVQDEEPVSTPVTAAAEEPGVTILPEDKPDSSMSRKEEAYSRGNLPEDRVQDAEEVFVKPAAEGPAEIAAEAFARRLAEDAAEDDTEALVESAAEAFARQERGEPTQVAAKKKNVTRQEEEAPGEKEAGTPPEAAAATNAQYQARSRRTKSGPQIYGQDSVTGFDGAQGVIRRDVHGGHAGEGVIYGSGISDNQAQPERRTQRTRRQSASGASGQPSSPQPSAAVDGRVTAEQGAAASGSRPVVRQPKPSVQPYAQIPQESRGSTQPMYHGGQSSGTARRIMEAAKDALTSPLLIVVALLQTVFLAGSIAAIFMRELSYGQIAKLLNLLNLPSQLSGYVSMFQTAMAQLDKGAVGINLAIRVPDMLFCLGLWLICILAHSSKEKMPGAGFRLIQIVTVINMIAVCAVLLVVLILSVTLVIAAWSAGTQSLIMIAVATLVGAIVVTMAIVMYFFCYLSTIQVMRTNARTGERCGKASAYVAVIHMILGLTGIINLLSGIVNLEVTGIVSGVGQLGWMLLFGVWILKYRSTLSEYND